MTILFINKEKGLIFSYQTCISYLAGVVGIEPTSMVLETTVLPLYYTPKCSNIITLIKKYFHTNIILVFLA